MFSIIKKEEVPIPKLGFYLEFYINENKKVILCENEKHLVKLFCFLRDKYNPYLYQNFSHYDEEFADFLVNYVGRNAYENPNSVTGIGMYKIVYEDYIFYKM